MPSAARETSGTRGRWIDPGSPTSRPAAARPASASPIGLDEVARGHAEHLGELVGHRGHGGLAVAQQPDGTGDGIEPVDHRRALVEEHGLTIEHGGLDPVDAERGVARGESGGGHCARMPAPVGHRQRPSRCWPPTPR